MKRRTWGFYAMFVLLVAGILVLSIILGAFIIGALYYSDLLSIERGNPLPVIIMIIFPSLMVGLFLSGLFGRIAIRPLNRLSDGLKAVASGDFSVRLKEKGKGQYSEVNSNFNQMARELESIEMLREDFIINVSHEFKTPLSSIQGYATLLQAPGLTEAEKAEYLEAIQSATRSLSNLSSNILELSNLETRTGELSTSRFSLDEQIRQTIVMLEPLCSEKRILLDIDLESTDIVANQELLETIWINLLGNAIKFSGEGGCITVRLRSVEEPLWTSPSHVEISFADTGYGIPEDQLSRIFDKFYQADSSRKSEGNGLGLALASTIVTKHGGNIEVSSVLYKGSVFTVRLPQQ